MGSCCSSSVNMEGEEFLRQLLLNDSLIIRTFDYMKLLNEIIDKRVDQQIPKKHIKEFLIPEFYDQEKSGNYDVYFQSLFDLIINQFDEENNMYLVLFYFYPFVRHSKEKIYENFFNCIRFMTCSKLVIVRKDLENWLLKYVTFCTMDITYSIYIKCPTGDDLSGSLSTLINRVFTETNIKDFTKKLISVLTDDSPVDLITVDMFKKMFNQYDISTIENVRDFILHDV